MQRYLLDTNICADLISHPQGPAAKRLFVVGAHLVGINWIVVAEMRFGARKKNSPVLTERVEALIHEMAWIEMPEHITTHYADIRWSLTQQGQLIGQNDLWLAAHARAQGLTLVTHNHAEFARVDGLLLQDWLI